MRKRASSGRTRCPSRARGGLVDGPVYERIFNTLKGLSGPKDDPFAAFQSAQAVYHDDFNDYSANEPTMDGTASAAGLVQELIPVFLPAGAGAWPRDSRSVSSASSLLGLSMRLGVRKREQAPRAPNAGAMWSALGPADCAFVKGWHCCNQQPSFQNVRITPEAPNDVFLNGPHLGRYQGPFHNARWGFARKRACALPWALSDSLAASTPARWLGSLDDNASAGVELQARFDLGSQSARIRTLPAGFSRQEPRISTPLPPKGGVPRGGVRLRPRNLAIRNPSVMADLRVWAE